MRLTTLCIDGRGMFAPIGGYSRAQAATASELILYMDCDIVSPIRMSISIPITVAFAELGRSIHHPKPTIALKRTSLHLPPASSPVRLRLPESRSV